MKSTTHRLLLAGCFFTLPGLLLSAAPVHAQFENAGQGFNLASRDGHDGGHDRMRMEGGDRMREMQESPDRDVSDPRMIGRAVHKMIDHSDLRGVGDCRPLVECICGNQPDVDWGGRHIHLEGRTPYERFLSLGQNCNIPNPQLYLVGAMRMHGPHMRGLGMGMMGPQDQEMNAPQQDLNGLSPVSHEVKGDTTGGKPDQAVMKDDDAQKPADQPPKKEDAGKGAKLANTATTLPLSAAVSASLALLGMAFLATRRVRVLRRK